MTSDPVVSVVLPVYNGEEILAEAVRSIQEQSFEDWELILLDDGSTDASLALCRRLAKDEGRIRVLENPVNRGLGAAMERLAGAARGKYVAVQEQDDVSLPERLRSEVELLESRRRIGLVSGLVAWKDAQGTLLRHFPGILEAGGQYQQDRREMVSYLYTEQCKVANPACMFRRSVLEEDGVGFDPRAKMSVDWQFFLHLAHRFRIWGLHRILVEVRRGHASLSSRKELQFREAHRCIERVYRCYRDDPESPIDARLRRRARATQRVLEGRTFGRWRGAFHLLQAVMLEPTRRDAWRSLAQLGRRAARKAVGRGRS